MRFRKSCITLLTVIVLSFSTLQVGAVDFDSNYYAEHNLDVVKQLGTSVQVLANHYNTYGRLEGRKANENDMVAELCKLFSPEEYATMYVDVAEVFGIDTNAMLKHYMEYGMIECRRPCEAVTQTDANELAALINEACGGVQTPGDFDYGRFIADVNINNNPTMNKIEELLSKKNYEVAASTSEVVNPHAGQYRITFHIHATINVTGSIPVIVYVNPGDSFCPNEAEYIGIGRHNYSFLGWTDLGPDAFSIVSFISEVQNNIALWAVWQQNETDCIFHHADGSVYLTFSTSITNELDPNATIGPSKLGYHFLGWSTSPTATADDVIREAGIYTGDENHFYPVYEPNTGLIIYYDNIEIFPCRVLDSMTAGVDQFSHGTWIPTRPGYEFAGWSTTSDNSSNDADMNTTALHPFVEETTYYAIWEALD